MINYYWCNLHGFIIKYTHTKLKLCTKLYNISQRINFRLLNFIIIMMFNIKETFLLYNGWICNWLTFFCGKFWYTSNNIWKVKIRINNLANSIWKHFWFLFVYLWIYFSNRLISNRFVILNNCFRFIWYLFNRCDRDIFCSSCCCLL